MAAREMGGSLKSTMAAVVPTAVSRRAPTRAPRCSLSRGHALLLILFVILCLVWLVVIVGLTVRPLLIINALMHTKDFDYGTFWLVSKASPQIVTGGVIALVCVGAGYVGVLTVCLRLLRRPKKSLSRATSFLSTILRANAVGDINFVNSRATVIERAVVRLARCFQDSSSDTQYAMAITTKIVEIALQCFILAQLLEGGMIETLCSLFAVIVALNALSSCIFCLLPCKNLGLVHVATDTAVDFVVAVLFPLLQVLVARGRFTFDRSLFEINRQMFPEGTFERTELTIADPTEVETTLQVIESLRINSVLKIFTRVGTNVSLLIHCGRLLGILHARRAGITTHRNEYPKNRLVAGLFGASAVFVVVWARESIRTSHEACTMHQACVRHAHHWITMPDKNDSMRCPCLALIDREITLSDYDDWVKPPDRTNEVIQLATPGYLQTLQLVNRGLVTIPEQLRRCKNLKHVSLFYTNTQTLPDWFGELTNLQFLHIEGKSFGPTPGDSLKSMPANLFDKMDSLLFLHLAALPLPALPSFDGLTNIRSMALAVLYQVESLPSFDKMRNLERLTIAVMAGLTVFPQLDHLEKLTSLVVADRGAFCCNGYLGTDRCNLTNSRCTYNVVSGMPAVTQCVSADKMASAATRVVFDKFHSSTCAMRALMLNELEVPPSRADMDQCNGTMYRQCVVPGYGVGMCYNPRWMAVSCYASPFAINMRRAQIAQKLGTPCNPEYEAWLGC